MKLCFTVDWEDWYHGLRLPGSEIKKLDRRIRIGHYKLLELLCKHKVHATFFLLGESMEEFPELVQEIKDEHHELACHTYSHPFITEISPERFHQEIKRCKELAKPFQDGYAGFRAPYFSINRSCLWAFEILKEEGFIYDSSIFPGNTFRSGIIGFEKNIHALSNGLLEFPISVFKILKFDFGSGGAYFRTLPYEYFKNRLTHLLTQRPGVFYLHPWELDHEQPYMKGLKARVVHTHYYNLRTTEKKLKRLLSDFEFVPLKEILPEKTPTNGD